MRVVSVSVVVALVLVAVGVSVVVAVVVVRTGVLAVSTAISGASAVVVAPALGSGMVPVLISVALFLGPGDRGPAGGQEGDGKQRQNERQTAQWSHHALRKSDS